MDTRKLLREFIESTINEMAEADVETSKDPIDWISAAHADPESWNEDFWRLGDQRGPFIAMKAAAKRFGLKEIGHGSSRTVYDIGHNKVIKIANDKKGIAQNELEDFAGQDPQVDKLLAHVHDCAEDYAWIVADKVDPLEDNDEHTAEGIVGVPWKEVIETLGLEPNKEDEMTKAPTTRSHQGKTRHGGKTCLQGQAFIDYLKTFLTRYKGMLPGDIAKTSSWGVTPKGCLVLLDYGITKKKFDELY